MQPPALGGQSWYMPCSCSTWMTRSETIKPVLRNAGFTLIELLVVIGILGVLAALAIQQFAQYRVRGFDATAESDLRNAATAEEAIYSTGGHYVTCADAMACQASLSGYKHSAGVTLAMTSVENSYTGTSMHVNGSKTWAFDTNDGRLIFSITP
jgi:type IV pilus assembly protein PilA